MASTSAKAPVVPEAKVSDPWTGSNQTKHVHTALGAILAALSVAKGGKLPANMGGNPYITAADLNAEIKRKFVENDLILIPNERIVKHESIQGNGGRLTIAIVIEGTYTIISTKDGSSVTVGGSGDGLATGSAVASNIASTNALKNALLRTFLVTEQSTEDAAKDGVGDAEAPVGNRALATARAATPKPLPATNALAIAKKKVQDKVTLLDLGYTAAELNRYTVQIGADKIPGEGKYEAVLKSLEAGVLLDEA